MKRIVSIAAIAVLSIVTAVQANAQMGIVAGFTSSSTSIDTKSFDASSVALYHVGLTYKLELGAGLAIQPELIYQMKGATLKVATENGGTVADVASAVVGTLQTKTGYLELPVEVQYGFDLGIAKPYLFVAPFLGYAITTKETSDGLAAGVSSLITNNNGEITAWADSAKNRLEYGIGGGIGVELLSRIQVSVQYFKNLGSLYKDGNTPNADAISESIKDVVKTGNYGGIKFSAVLFF